MNKRDAVSHKSQQANYTNVFYRFCRQQPRLRTQRLAQRQKRVNSVLKLLLSGEQTPGQVSQQLGGTSLDLRPSAVTSRFLTCLADTGKHVVVHSFSEDELDSALTVSDTRLVETFIDTL